MIFFNHGDLTRVATQVAIGPSARAARQDRTGDHPWCRCTLQLTLQEIRHRRPNSGADQTWLAHQWAREGHNTFATHHTRFQQAANGDHILIANAPDSLSGGGGLDEMHMGAGKTRRMRTVKTDDLNTICAGDGGIARLTEVSLPLTQNRDGLKPRSKLIRRLVDDHTGIRSQRF